MTRSIAFLIAITSLCAPACSSRTTDRAVAAPSSEPASVTAPSSEPASVTAPSSKPASVTAPPQTNSEGPTARANQTPSSTTPSSEPPFSTTPSSADQGLPCGALGCLAFESAEAALGYLIEKTHPLVLGVGEIHAQKGHRLKATPTERFAALLPYFKGKSLDLVLELWTPRNDCGDDRVKRVEKAQKPVTEAQAATNKNVFFELGVKAKALGIFPRALVPTCEDYGTIVHARADDLATMLALTAKQTVQVVGETLKTRQGAKGRPLVITYGGTLHNDLYPSEARQSWSFGPALQEITQGQFVELDLVLREQVRDTDSFKAFPWYGYFRAETLDKQYVLYEMAASSYALVFPEQALLP